jgi:hypothetical protein
MSTQFRTFSIMRHLPETKSRAGRNCGFMASALQTRVHTWGPQPTFFVSRFDRSRFGLLQREPEFKSMSAGTRSGKALPRY